MSKNPLVKCLVLGIVAFSATLSGRLSAEPSANALRQELPTERAERETSPHRLPPHKRMELARRLLAERGYNSTNRPSSKVLGEILADAGTIRPKRAIWTSNHATPIAPMDNVTTDAGRNTSKDDGSSHARAYPKAASGSRQYVRIRGVGGLIAHMLPESAKPEVSASLLVELPLLLLGGVLLIAVLAFVIGFVARRLRSRNPWHGYGRDDYYECDDNDDEG